MSTGHTPGRVKVQHPHAGERGYEVAFEPGLEQLCQDITEANARRLVACWNLLSPFTTEQIEAGEADVVALAAQRDELLEALAALMDDALLVRDGIMAAWALTLRIHEAHAAIAKVTNQAGTGPANKKDAHP